MGNRSGRRADALKIPKPASASSSENNIVSTLFIARISTWSARPDRKLKIKVETIALSTAFMDVKASNGIL